MYNDLISREALLKRVDEERKYLIARGQTGAEHILVHNFRDLIENAPTVNLSLNLGNITKEDIEKFKMIMQRANNKGLRAISALTVEPCYQTTSCLDCKMYDKEKHNCPRFCEVIKSAIEERPQGEWIVDKDSIFENFKKCSNCNEGAEWLDGGSQFLSNFCPNCGADMHGGES